MPNLTVELVTALLDRAEALARGEKISLNQLVRDLITQKVESPNTARPSLAEWFALSDKVPMNPPPLLEGKSRDWSREELHRGSPA